MTRISELRRALDQEAARLESPRGLESRVLLALREADSRTKRRALPPAPTRLSGRALQLVAGVLVLAVFVSLVVLGRDLRRPIAPHLYSLTATERAELAELEARPLDLHRLAVGPGAYCPITSSEVTPFRGGISALEYGTGPVWGEAGHEVLGSSYTYWDVEYYTDPSVSGPVLIRGGSLEGGSPLVFAGTYAAGPQVASDVAGAQRLDIHSEAVLPAGHAPKNALAAPGWGIWPLRQGLPAGASDCIGVQIDTLAGTELVGLGRTPFG